MAVSKTKARATNRRRRGALRRGITYETEAWPYLEAKFHGPKRSNPTRLVIIHTPEWPESSSGAEAVARYFHDMPDGREASCHITIDSDSIVQCVKDSFVAWAAPGANHDGIQIELTGFANQTAAQWRDKFSLAALALAADATAQYCLKYDIPVKLLTVAEVKDGRTKGICGHATVTAAFHKSDHTDPGQSFPWKRFMAYVQASYEERRLAA